MWDFIITWKVLFPLLNMIDKHVKTRQINMTLVVYFLVPLFISILYVHYYIMIKLLVVSNTEILKTSNWLLYVFATVSDINETFLSVP